MKRLLIILFALIASSAAMAQVSSQTARRLAPSTFAGLGTAPNGSVRYCSNCSANTSPCAGGGTGAQATRVNGAWACSTASAVTGITNSAPSGTLPKSIDGSGNLGASRISDNGGSTIAITADANTIITLDAGAGHMISVSGSGQDDQVGLAAPTINAFATTAINLDSGAGTTTIGDVNGAGPGNIIRVDAANGVTRVVGGFQTESSLGGNDGAQINSTEVKPLIAASMTLGTAPFPFSALFIGNAANNSSQITCSTCSGNRVHNMPDISGNVVVDAATQTLTNKTLTSPVITNIVPGAPFTLTQNSVAVLTSNSTAAVANSLYVNAGVTIHGHTAAQGRLGETLEVVTGSNFGGAALSTFSTTGSHAPILDFNKSNSAAKGTQTVGASGDVLGNIVFNGSDATNFETAAYIAAAIDGTPGNDDMPGRLMFFTAADGTKGGTERLRIDNAGKMYYLTPGTDAAHTDASLCRDTTTGELMTGTGTLGICLGTSFAASKTNLKPLDYGVKEVMRLRPVSFNYRPGHGYATDKRYLGFTSESVKPIMPDLAPTDQQGNPLSVDLVGMVPVLVRAIQQQQQEIDVLKAEVKRLKRKRR